MRKGSGADYYQISIRFSPDESQLIQQLAEKNGRSFNKEVLHLVKAQLSLEQTTKKEPLQSALPER